MTPEKIRVVALGGCGGMGQFAVRTALDFDFVDEIVIADRDGDRAREFAAQFVPKTKPVTLDIMDSASLKKVLEGADVVLATVGPYYRFGVPVLRAAIEAKCHYLDINDDWEPTLEMLKLDEEAQKADITAVVGMGASPGLSNLLAVKAMSLLDTVDELITAWGPGGMDIRKVDKPGQGGTYRAAIEHWMQQITGKIRIRRDGKFMDAPPMKDIKIDYPGIGTVTTHTVGHPEPVTLPLFRPEIKDSCNVMEMPTFFIEPLKWIAGQVNAGRMDLAEATEQIIQLEKGTMGLLFTKLGRRSLRSLIREKGNIRTVLPMVCAIAIGTRDGKKKTVAASLSSIPFGGMKRENMGGATGVPMATALALLQKGKILRRGVSPPEGAIDPDAFFDELAPFCTPFVKSSKELLTITTSP